MTEVITEVINGIEVTDYREEGPEDGPPVSMADLKVYIDAAVEERTAIQLEINKHSEILRKEKNVGMDGPLVDKDQYPRADIDLVAVRTSRQQLIRNTNDMRKIMCKIETALFQLHQSARSQNANLTATVQSPVQPPTRPPFLRVHGVLPGSPAATSGLKDDDQICQLGSLHKENFTGLGDVAEVVRLSVNKAVALKLLRDGTPKTIALKPCSWSGRGVLGCNVVEL